MKCPHCQAYIHEQWEYALLEWDGNKFEDKRGFWQIKSTICPNCNKATFHFQIGGFYTTGEFYTKEEIRVYPIGSSRSPCPEEVPPKFAEDYREACLVLPYSAKASAALSRRCLQDILRDVAKVKKSNLSNEIQEVLDRGNLPSHITESIDAVRNIGNFAAHPLKSKTTGEIVSVEPEEAEWNLDVLEFLFDYYFVLPKKVKKKKESLDMKLKDSGKKGMK